MTLEQTKETILIWVRSCTTKEQLQLLEKVADEFVVQRFIGNYERGEIIAASYEISNAIDERHQEIIIHHNPPVPEEPYFHFK